MTSTAITSDTKIKVSVCIPIYGVEKYIERCARSLFEQTMTDGIEFIFVNDCTKDKSIEILEQVLSEYPQRKNQVKIIHHEKNGGLVAARNTGLKHAAGDYIIHCDSDDWVDINMYEAMYNKAIETNADMVYCDYFLAQGDNLKLYTQKTCNSFDKLLCSIFSGDCHGALWNKLYKREIAVQKFYVPDDIIMTEDVLRNVQMLTKVKQTVHISQPLYYYNFVQNSISNSRSKKCFENEKTVVSFIEKNIIPVCNCRASLNVYKRRILTDAIRFQAIEVKEFRSLYPDAKRELFTHILLPDSLKRRLLLTSACCCFYFTSYVLQFLLKIK